jgi:hypothetical protein
MRNTKFLSKDLKGRDHLGDLEVDGKSKGKVVPVLFN